MLGAKGWLILSGIVLVALGIYIRWRTARYDLKDAAIGSAWTLARGKRTAENPTTLEQKFSDIRAQQTWTGRATKAGGIAAGHFASQVLAVVALVLVAASILPRRRRLRLGLGSGVAAYLSLPRVPSPICLASWERAAA
jgi:hypothetical protein